MEIEAWEVAHLRARRADVHPVMVAIAHYPSWWPGLEVVPEEDGAWRLAWRPPGPRGLLPGRAHQLRWRVTQERPGLGLRVTVHGDLVGRAEWYYLDRRAGITVHYLIRAQAPDRGGARLVQRHRRAVRAGLQELKARVERHRHPGDEPSPALLGDQRAALEASRRRAQVHARRQRGDGPTVSPSPARKGPGALGDRGEARGRAG